MSIENLNTAGRFSDRLRAARLRQGLSQEDLARKLGVSNGAVGNWESGPTIPRPQMLRKIEGLLGIDIDTLLYGSTSAARRENPSPNPQVGTVSHYSWMETSTLEKILSDLAARLPAAVSAARKEILVNLSEVVSELSSRDPASPSIRAVGRREEKAQAPLTEAQKIAQSVGKKYDSHRKPKR